MTEPFADLGPRVSVIGISGSGKTWVAARIAERLGVPHVEMDAIRHGPNWTETPDDEFRRRIAEVAATDGWVIDGNYAEIVRDLIWARATGVVWLDLPKRTVMRQVIARSFTRALGRKELWNGNREQMRNWVDPGHPIRWAWEQYARKQAREAEMVAAATNLKIVHLRSSAEVRRWLDGVRSTPTG